MSKSVVLLDFGHEESVQGKHSPDRSFFEWRFNRDLGLRIFYLLESCGVDVRIVNPETTYVSLTERANRVNRVCDEVGTSNVLLISIHSNAAGAAGNWMNARGWSDYVAKSCSQGAKDLATLLTKKAEELGFKIRKPMPNQYYWQENFTVLTKTKCKAVLTENLFYDNREDLRILQSDEGKQLLTLVHVNAILEYIKINPDEINKNNS